MSKNQVFAYAEDLSFLVGAGTLSGDPVRIGSINGIAITDSAITGTFGFPANVNGSSSGNTVGHASVTCHGAYNVSCVLTADREAGSPIYAIANGNPLIKKVTLTDVASGNKVWGHLYGAGVTGTAVRTVIIQPTSE